MIEPLSIVRWAGVSLARVPDVRNPPGPIIGIL